jgi:hypothetical protein
LWTYWWHATVSAKPAEVFIREGEAGPWPGVPARCQLRRTKQVLLVWCSVIRAYNTRPQCARTVGKAYILTAWSRVLLEKLTSKLCS